MPQKRYRKGDKVRFQMGVSLVEGVITEDRGPIGVSGRHLYEIEFPWGEEPSQVELPAEEFELVESAVSPERR